MPTIAVAQALEQATTSRVLVEDSIYQGTIANFNILRAGALGEPMASQSGITYRAICHAGPWVVATDVYVVGVSTDLRSIQVAKSSDDGRTWSIMDAGGFTAYTRDIQVLSSYLSGTQIHIATQLAYDSVNAPVDYHVFDTATDTWSTTKESIATPTSFRTPGILTAPDNVQAVCIAVRPDGDVLVIYQGDASRVMGTDYGRIKLARKESGSWTTDIDLDPGGENNNWRIHSMAMSPSGRAHIGFDSFYQGNRNTSVRTIRPDNSLSAIIQSDGLEENWHAVPNRLLSVASVSGTDVVLMSDGTFPASWSKGTAPDYPNNRGLLGTATDADTLTIVNEQWAHFGSAWPESSIAMPWDDDYPYYGAFVHDGRKYTVYHLRERDRGTEELTRFNLLVMQEWDACPDLPIPLFVQYGWLEAGSDPIGNFNYHNGVLWSVAQNDSAGGVRVFRWDVQDAGEHYRMSFPLSDAFVGGWSNDDGSTVDLYQRIDEDCPPPALPPGDDYPSYIKYPGHTNTYQANIGIPSARRRTNHWILVSSVINGAGSQGLRVQLLQDGATKAVFESRDLGTGSNLGSGGQSNAHWIPMWCPITPNDASDLNGRKNLRLTFSGRKLDPLFALSNSYLTWLRYASPNDPLLAERVTEDDEILGIRTPNPTIGQAVEVSQASRFVHPAIYHLMTDQHLNDHWVHNPRFSRTRVGSERVESGSGELYFNPVTKRYEYWDGTTWHILAIE